MKHTLILSALFAVGMVLGASAAPRHLTPKKHVAEAGTIAIGHLNRPRQGTPGGFRDVPPDHWAAKSVETLRRAGIVKGYPASAKPNNAKPNNAK